MFLQATKKWHLEMRQKQPFSWNLKRSSPRAVPGWAKPFSAKDQRMLRKVRSTKAATCLRFIV